MTDVWDNRTRRLLGSLWSRCTIILEVVERLMGVFLCKDVYCQLWLYLCEVFVVLESRVLSLYGLVSVRTLAHTPASLCCSKKQKTMGSSFGPSFNIFSFLARLTKRAYDLHVSDSLKHRLFRSNLLVPAYPRSSSDLSGNGRLFRSTILVEVKYGH
jgi:hypothetical protein